MAFAQLEPLPTLEYTGCRNQAVIEELHHLSPFSKNTCQVLLPLARCSTLSQPVYKKTNETKYETCITQLQGILQIQTWFAQGCSCKHVQ